MASPANQGHLRMLTAVFPDYLNNLAKLLAMLIFSSYLRFVFSYSTNIMTIKHNNSQIGTTLWYALTMIQGEWKNDNFYIQIIYLFIYLALPQGRITVGPYIPCQLSLWEETGVPGENPRLSAERWLYSFSHIMAAIW